MATRRKKPTPADLAGNADPRAPLDAAALLEAAKPLLKELAADLLARADGSLAVTEALRARHAQEQKAERTADAYPEWRRALVEQVAAAWLLSCVFVRTLEDRGLLGKNRIAGTGAQDSWKVFLQLAPSLSEREYLLTVFRELGRLPAAAELFDARHNPVWLLAPSAEAARKLLDLFRSPNADAPQFRFGGDDTRFLGDLYQDLSEDVRNRYALLQTPRFVEGFILDRALEPAIERFGLDDTNLIDPTCGSGHFLLGAFERLFNHRLRAEPGMSPRAAATKALDAVAGSDINPYAIAIARFRLTLAFIEKCGLRRLKDVPRLPLHLAVADSLYFNPHVPQLALASGTDPSEWDGDRFSLSDATTARDVLFQQYAVVVGNPPYVTVKDRALRDLYRRGYASASMQYSLGAVFTERFFQLARARGSVGLVTANSFMKREFGKALVEKCLPNFNLQLVVNTSGAFIPGHGTPTVLLFGTAERPEGAEVQVVLAERGEPSTPSVPENGLVWSSIVAHWNDIGFRDDFISVAKLARPLLSSHPWSLGGGGAIELKELLEERCSKRLRDLVRSMGRVAHTGNDETFVASRETLLRFGMSAEQVVEFVEGESLRDWALSSPSAALFPYDPSLAVMGEEPGDPRIRRLWLYRTMLWERREPNGSHREIGLTWYEFSRFHPERFVGPGIAFAFVATHNHFVLDHGGKVFKQSAPKIKLPETATEDDHLVLLAYLNSSTACFWMKQVFHDKGSGTDSGNWQSEPAKIRYEFAGTGLAALPLPDFGLDQRARLVDAAKALCGLGAARGRLADDLLESLRSASDHASTVQAAMTRDEQILAEMIALQERIDWTVYETFGLCSAVDVEAIPPGPIPLGQRPFEVALARRGINVGIDGQSLLDSGGRADKLLEAIRVSPELTLLEAADYKRRWLITPKHLAGRVLTFRDRFEHAVLGASERLCEQLVRDLCVSGRSTTARAIEDVADTYPPMKSLDEANRIFDPAESKPLKVSRLLAINAVPFLAAFRFTAKGLEKHARWCEVWELQRDESSSRERTIAPPPRYLGPDFQSDEIEALRGKLDVPNERFISYPGCESDEDKEPVYGWAGWDHLQRAVALAGLYQDRKQREGWTKDRLAPMLAGLLELLPWLKQWHHEPSAELGGERPSDQFEAFLNAECGEFGFTHDDLRAWRPAAKGRGAKPKATKKRGSADAEAEA